MKKTIAIIVLALCLCTGLVSAQTRQTSRPLVVLYSVYNHIGQLQFIGLGQAVRKASLPPGLYIYTTSDNRRGKFSVQAN